MCVAKSGVKSTNIKVGTGLLARVGIEVRHILPPHSRRTFVISNRKVFGLYGDQLVRSLHAKGFKVIPWLIGEREVV